MVFLAWSNAIPLDFMSPALRFLEREKVAVLRLMDNAMMALDRIYPENT